MYIGQRVALWGKPDHETWTVRDVQSDGSVTVQHDVQPLVTLIAHKSEFYSVGLSPDEMRDIDTEVAWWMCVTITEDLARQIISWKEAATA
jgi:hypothetical protein